MKYSFDDEPVCKFCIDLKNKKIEMYFNSYFNITENEEINQPCIFVIENWKNAKSKIGDEERMYDLNHHLGIFSIILYMKYNDNKILEILVNTIDNRYVTLFFEEPNLILQ